jgi:hypothetical protein
MHLKPTTGCLISPLISEKKCGVGSLYISHEKYIKDGNVLAHLGFRLKELPVSLTDISA